MRRIARLLIAATLAGSTGLALHLSDAAAQQLDPTRPQPAEPAAARTPEDEARRARVVARVGDVRITVGEVEDQIARQSPFMRARYRDPAQMRELVDNMLRFELLAREAERQGFGNDREVREATAQSAVQLYVRERFDERITPDSISAEDVRAFYDAHPEEFRRPELRRASHILLATREEATEMLGRVRNADARTFRQFAQERSLDAESRARGGDLRYFDAEGRGTNTTDPTVEAALARAAFGLDEVGDVSEPIEVGGQWSIVKLTGRRPAEHRSLEESAPSIRLRLWRERRQEEIDRVVERLRTQARVEVHYDRMRPIRMDPPDRLAGEDEHAAEAADEGETDELTAPAEPAESE